MNLNEISAYEILSDSEKRKKYDMFGEEGVGQGNRGGFRGEEFGGYQNRGPEFGQKKYTRFHQSGGGGGFPFDSFFGGQEGKSQFEFNFGGFQERAGGGGFFDNIFSSFGGGGFGREKRGSSSDIWKSIKGVEILSGNNFNSLVLEAPSEESWLVFFAEVSDRQAESAKPVVEEVSKTLQGFVKV